MPLTVKLEAASAVPILRIKEEKYPLFTTFAVPVIVIVPWLSITYQLFPPEDVALVLASALRVKVAPSKMAVP